jgi:ABC-type dipeptide/oligopeptide/nickel transport system permease subunit
MAFSVESVLVPPSEQPTGPRMAALRGVLRAARRDPLGAVAGVACVLLVLLAILGPSIAPYRADASEFPRLSPPSLSHPLGTDNLFRDILSRIVVGARISLGVGFTAVFISTLLGVVLGIVSGYLGGVSDLIVSRAIDVMLVYPGIVFLIFLVSIYQASFWSISIAIGLVLAPASTRVIRGSTIAVRHLQFVEAAVALGCSPLRIMVRHIVPNVASSIIVIASIQIGVAILAEAALSFIGLGISSASQPSWGRMLQETRPVWQSAWWTAVVPGMAISLTVLAFNIFGDALRDALDARLRGSR